MAECTSCRALEDVPLDANRKVNPEVGYVGRACRHLDATTAFAVPNPNYSSQSSSVFSGLDADRVAPACKSPGLLRSWHFIFANPFGRRRCKGNTRGLIVNAHPWCNLKFLAVDFRFSNPL